MDKLIAVGLGRVSRASKLRKRVSKAGKLRRRVRTRRGTFSRKCSCSRHMLTTLFPMLPSRQTFAGGHGYELLRLSVTIKTAQMLHLNNTHFLGLLDVEGSLFSRLEILDSGLPLSLIGDVIRLHLCCLHLQLDIFFC